MNLNLPRVLSIIHLNSRSRSAHPHRIIFQIGTSHHRQPYHYPRVAIIHSDFHMAKKQQHHLPVLQQTQVPSTPDFSQGDPMGPEIPTAPAPPERDTCIIWNNEARVSAPRVYQIIYGTARKPHHAIRFGWLRERHTFESCDAVSSPNHKGVREMSFRVCSLSTTTRLIAAERVHSGRSYGLGFHALIYVRLVHDAVFPHRTCEFRSVEQTCDHEAMSKHEPSPDEA
jgi:hypothetical protein